MDKIKASFSSLILMLMWSTNGWAQFNPQNPEEPSINYKIELECIPADIADLSGGGSYQDGSYVYINTYPHNSNYEFQYWEYNGEIYSRNSDFMYLICTRDAKFIAHYKYNPYNPEEPNAHFMRKLFLKSQPEGIASFNYSNGDKFELGSVIGIYETGRRWGYDFKGWYEDGQLVSNTVEFEYTVPDRDVTLVAHYEFNPETPGDPYSFYSTSCEFLAESDNIEKGTVSVEGLDKGRAVYGSSITLNATSIDENSFCGWYIGDSLLSVNPDYTFTVPSSSNRIYIVAIFKYKPHNLTYMNDGEVVADFVYETGDSLSVLPDMEKDGYTFLGWQGFPEVMPDEDVVVTGSFKLAKIRISQSSIQLEGGEKQLIKAYAGSTNMEEVTDVIWTIDNNNIATISNSGIVKGLSKGSTVITATAKNDSQVSASAPVNVTSDNHKVDLPPVEFEFNYNAANYDSEKNRIANDLEARLYKYNLQLTENIPEFSNGKLSIEDLCKGYIDKWDIESLESGKYFSRTASDSLTIICKVKPRFDNSTNRSDFISLNSSSNTNYSLRIGYKNAIYLATKNLYSNRYLNYEEDTDQIFAVRACKGKVILQNLTTGESKVLSTNTWGSTTGSMNIFYNNASNYFTGDFFWTYLAKGYLSDGEIWDVVDYNENVDIYSIPNVTMGDANNSGVVNVTDISTVADYLFGNYPGIFNYKASDVNMNRAVNVADIAGIVDLIYGHTSHAVSKRRSGITNDNGVTLTLSQITPGAEAVINININNTSEISAVEMNLILPQGLTVIDSEMDIERGGNRVFRGGYVDGAYKMMAYSMANDSFNGNEGKLFSVKVKASDDMIPSEYDIYLSDIVFSGDGEEIIIQPFRRSFIVDGTTTVMSKPEKTIEIKIYDLLGREVDSKSPINGPYIMRESINGKVIRTYKVIR